MTESSDDQYLRKTITSRDVTYSFVELESEDYDECVELARGEPTPDFPDGPVDTAKLLKFMLPKSLVEPKMSLAEVNKLPMGVRRDLLTAVNELHWPEVAPAKKAAEPGKD